MSNQPHTEHRSRPTVLVTGASRGIGAALCRRLAQDGSNPMITARSAAELGQLRLELAAAYGVEVRVVAADLSQNDGVFDLMRAWDAAQAPIDLLVNSAGVGDHGDFARSRWQDQTSMLISPDAWRRMARARRQLGAR